MTESNIKKKTARVLLLFAINLLLLFAFSVTTYAATKPYEVTKSGSCAVRVDKAESASVAYRANQGSILWVTGSGYSSAGKLWYKLTDGRWVFSGNVKAHSCSWSWVSGTNPTCTASGSTNYKCYKCGQTKKTTKAALGHKYSKNVCTVCNAWNSSSLKSSSSVNNVKYYVKTDGAAVHTGPYDGCKVTTHLAKGTNIIVTQKMVNASNNTWYKYSGGYIFGDYVVQHSSCSWNSGTVTKKATCQGTGTKVQYCTICGASKTTTLAKTGHSYSANVCTVCNTWNTSSLKSSSSVNNVKYYVKTDGAAVHTGPYDGCKVTTHLAKGTNIIVTQKMVNASNNTWYKYSGGYIFGDYVIKHSSCTWNSGTVTKKATCQSTGTKVQYCTICGVSKTSTLSKTGHSYSGNVCTVCNTWKTSSIKSSSSVNNVKYYVKTNGAAVHTGPYGKCKTVKSLPKGTSIYVTQKLVNADNNTWYKFDDGYIFGDYVIKHSSCTWNSGTVTKKATCQSTGTKVQYCTICGVSKTSTLSKTGHSYSGNVCTVCNTWKTSSIKSSSSVNKVKYCVKTNNAAVHTGPYGKCKTVKYLPKGTIIYVTQKLVNADNNTWYKFADGYIFGDYVIKHSSCTWNSGSVTKKATCTATGTKVKTCTYCGKTKNTTISKAAHKYEGNVCKVCNAWKASSLKSKTNLNNAKYYIKVDGAAVHSGPYGKCKTTKYMSKGASVIVTQKIINAENNTWYKFSDGYVFGDYVNTHSSCTWNSGSVTKKATCTATGTKVKTCIYCGKTKNTTISKTAHKYEGNVCKVCNAWKASSLKSKTNLNNAKYYIKVDGAAVHSGPYGKCKTTKYMSKGTYITVTQKIINAENNTWYKFSDGYIFSDYVDNKVKVTLSKDKSTLYVAQTVTLKASVVGPSDKVKWKSNKSSVASVNSSGKVTAKKSGTCKITATSNGKSDTCTITVKQLAAPKSVKLATSNYARKFSISHKAVSGADGYEVYYKSKHKTTGENLTVNSSAVTGAAFDYVSGTAEYKDTAYTVTLPKSDSVNYACTVRAYKLIDGKKYYGKASKQAEVHVHNSKTATQQYTKNDYSNHYLVEVHSCTDGKIKTKKKKESHTFTCGICQKCGQKKASSLVVSKFLPNQGKGPAYSSAGNGKKSPIHVAVPFSDKLFLGSNTEFNSSLCKVSAAGAAATYTTKYAEQFLADCGFGGVKSENSSSKKSTSKASTDKINENDHARYIIGFKKLSGTDTTLVAVLINGYTDGSYEWISNFNVGKDETKLHTGFSRAANEVTDKVAAYIKSKKINTSKMKIWITGHSRAGAVTGMTAVNLQSEYKKCKIYAYGFATPNGVPERIAKNTKSNYIFNIVNPGDFVPYVVPEKWEFTKFGTTRVLDMDSTAKKYYKAMTGDSYSGLSVNGRDKLITAFNQFSPSRGAYYTNMGNGTPKDFGRALGLFMSDAGLCGEALKLLGKCGLDQATYNWNDPLDKVDNGNFIKVLGKMIWDGSLTSNINEAHCMDTYLALVFAKYP